MIELIQEYKDSLRKIREAKKRYQIKETEEQMEQHKLLGSMERELQDVIQWLITGRQPGNRRGVERLAAYQRETLCDTLWIQNYYSTTQIVNTRNKICNDNRSKLNKALEVLSPLEREVFVMHKGSDMSMSEIAKMLGVTKGTVQKMIERGGRKLERYKDNYSYFVG